ncbi:MAG: SAM-dependent methyltransferase [Bacteroidetes bacterium]|nr:SAM-dependent methyltransferase [Bacteroidota bacterium]
MERKGKLYLVPAVIAENAEATIPSSVLTALKTIDHFLAENIRTARRYLSSLKLYDSIEQLTILLLNKDTTKDELKFLLEPLYQGKNIGVLSESGCPGIADPGAMAVAWAHENDINVVPLVGPSSVLLALMASGLNGQQFAFHGYLPIDAHEQARKIKELEKESIQKKQTQLFIETPYRNNQLVKNLLQNLRPQTRLCIAFNLTGQTEFIRTKSISAWKENTPVLGKEPAIFLFQADVD